MSNSKVYKYLGVSKRYHVVFGDEGEVCAVGPGPRRRILSANDFEDLDEAMKFFEDCKSKSDPYYSWMIVTDSQSEELIDKWDMYPEGYVKKVLHDFAHHGGNPDMFKKHDKGS